MQFTFAFHIWGLSEKTWITRLSRDSLRFTWIYLDRLHDSPECGCSPPDPYRAADPPRAGVLLSSTYGTGGAGGADSDLGSKELSREGEHWESLPEDLGITSIYFEN